MTESFVLNAQQQPVGASMERWTTRPLPERCTIEGTYCRLEALDATRHADDLYAAYSVSPDPSDWTYLSVGPFSDKAEFRQHIEALSQCADPLQYAVIDASSGRAVGTFSLLRIDPKNGVIEVGFVVFSDLLKRTPISTEAQYLLMRYVFEDLGYRRYEWKCDALNAPSRKTAQRLGFQFEGIFRQAVVYKGRSRDTAWFSIIDGEWPVCQQAFEKWLRAENFDVQGRQLHSLETIRQSLSQAAR